MNDLVSVIMSTFNSESTVSVAIESILEQSYSNLEFLIVDDASNDNTVKIIEEYCKNSRNIRLFKNDVNVGLTKNLNFLINQSKGEFIARQDDDDYSLPDRLNVQVQTIKKNNLDFCSTRALVIDNEEEALSVMNDSYAYRQTDGEQTEAFEWDQEKMKQMSSQDLWKIFSDWTEICWDRMSDRSYYIDAEPKRVQA